MSFQQPQNKWQKERERERGFPRDGESHPQGPKNVRWNWKGAKARATGGEDEVIREYDELEVKPASR